MYDDYQDTPTAIVRAAFERDPYAFRRICSRRAGADPEHAGAHFPRRSPEQVEAMMMALVWEPYTHVRVSEPQQAFLASMLPGLMGVAHVDEVAADAELALSSSPETGLTKVVWRRPPPRAGHRATHVVVIVEPDGVGYQLVDLFPGDPIEPTWFPFSGPEPGRVSTDDLRRYGVQWVEIASP